MTAASWPQRGIFSLSAKKAARRSLAPTRDGFDLPSTPDLLTEGGDARIMLDPATGCNKYGCPTLPDPALQAYGSCTASVISGRAFQAANRLRNRIARAAEKEPATVIYARELGRQRHKLLRLCGLDLAETGVLFAASGTDLHLLAGKITAGSNAEPSLAIMVEASETGSGVGSALGGRHFNNCTALGDQVTEGSTLDDSSSEVVSVSLRKADGSPRPLSEIDGEVERMVTAAAAQKRNILLTMVDVSKTGLMAPSPACALALRRRFPASLDILVDACQFRLRPATLQAYLAEGFMVMVTGSKFLTGPTFSGALLMPRPIAEKYRERMLEPGLKAYSAHAEWPLGWPAALSLKHVANFGLLLRWEAALTEFAAFNALPEGKIANFVENFAARVNQKLADDPVFKPISAPRLDRSALSLPPGWDDLQSIFAFKLHHPATGPLSSEETTGIYRLLQQEAPRYQLGQPVACGGKGSAVGGALRLCLSARLIAEALNDSKGADRVIANALSALDKTADLVRRIA